MRIGIIAALPGELRPLVRGWQKLAVAPASGIAMWQQTRAEDDLIAVCAGMGATAARRAFIAAEHAGSLDLVLNIGWAGGLTHSENPGIVISEIIDAQTGERFLLTDGARRLRLVTTARVADAQEKHRLAASYGAVAVDMEASAIARLAQMRGIPMGCFKAISDRLELKLPDINPFIDEAGKLRMSNFLAHVAPRPRYWGSLMAMSRSSRQASHRLARAVNNFLVHKDLERTNRTGDVE